MTLDDIAHAEELTPNQRDRMPLRYQQVWSAAYALAWDRDVERARRQCVPIEDCDSDGAAHLADTAVIQLAKYERE